MRFDNNFPSGSNTKQKFLLGCSRLNESPIKYHALTIKEDLPNLNSYMPLKLVVRKINTRKTAFLIMIVVNNLFLSGVRPHSR